MQEITCKRCGLKSKRSGDFCPACGYDFNLRSGQSSNQNTQENRSQTAARPSAQQTEYNVRDVSYVELFENKGGVNSKTVISQQDDMYEDNSIKIWSKKNLIGSLGWRKLVGTVIVSEPPYMTKPISHWAVKSIKIPLLIFFFPVIISVLIAAMMASFIYSFLSFGRGARPGFLSSIASQVIGFFLTGKLFGPKDQIPVRDVRIRDKNGNEHLIRIAGELIAGNFNVGDEIEALGFNRRGTLIFYKGRNYRTGTEIIVKKR